MIIEVEVQDGRTAHVTIPGDELAAVHLHLAFPAQRNRSGLYMRRHPLPSEIGVPASSAVGPNRPRRSPQEPAKITIPEHIEAMRRRNLLPEISRVHYEGGENFRTEPAMLAVPVSDLVANLLRPCFHRSGFGQHKLFHLDGEPITRTTYWCLCFFQERGNVSGRVDFFQVRFDPMQDTAFDIEGHDLLDVGLVWAAALVPLVVNGSPVPPVTIAQKDYDLRQLLGRDAEEQIQYAYNGWYDEWNTRVEEVLEQHQTDSKPFSTFYHSILALDRFGNVHVYQTEGTLPELAERLAGAGMVAAGLLDSGGSCALYDVWMASYLNHGWYFREPRGAILVFELTSSQRLPDSGQSGSWLRRREE